MMQKLVRTIEHQEKLDMWTLGSEQGMSGGSSVSNFFAKNLIQKFNAIA